MADIEALLAAGKGRKAKAAISKARRNLELTGSQARALGKRADEAGAASPEPNTKGRKK